MMRRTSLVLALLLGLLAVAPAHATVAYYQPTPYPLWKYGSTKQDPKPMSQNLDIVHIWDGWLPSVYYNQKFQRDNGLRVGGWGDEYLAYLKFDMAGLPKTVNGVMLYVAPITPATGVTMTPVDVYLNTRNWDPATLVWGNRPSANLFASMPTPVVGQWSGVNITTQYRGWMSGSNYGLYFKPQRTDNNFNTFFSSRHGSDGGRPLLAIDFTPPAGMPNFKMPLPGGATWLLTNEIGGYECMGENPWPDTAHQGDNYFSIDLSPTNRKDGGGSYAGDIPILAAANGKVAFVGTDPNVPNGYHIVLNHSGSTSQTSGYTTKYLHLKSSPMLSVGANVLQGDQIGIMGTTGRDSQGRPTSTAVHLHFGVYYNGYGRVTDTNLTYVTMDGWLLKSFQTECKLDDRDVPTTWKRYYRSSLHHMKVTKKIIVIVIVGIITVGIIIYFLDKKIKSGEDTTNIPLTQGIYPIATSSSTAPTPYVPPDVVQPVQEWTSVSNTPLSLSSFSFNLPSGWYGSVYNKEGGGQHVLVQKDSSAFTIDCPPDGKGLEAATVLSTQERVVVSGATTYTLSFEKWTAPSNTPWLFVWLRKNTMEGSPEVTCLAQGDADSIVATAMEELYKTWK